MKKFGIFVFILVCFSSLQASWYWPFGSDETEEKPKRVSELIEPASLLIDEASDLAAEGKTKESVEKYRESLKVLDQIEAENPERAKKPEFATLRNKRAYVTAAIDSLLLDQVKSNAKAVAVSDTTELEKRLAAEKAGKKKEKTANPSPTLRQTSAKPSKPSKPLTKREQALVAISSGDWTTAERVIGKMLIEKPNGAVALNLKAVMEVQQGKLKEAESTLDQAILSNPRNHFAYYNMAKLMLQVRKDDKTIAKRYYETGRTFGGPVDAHLEEVFK